MRFLLFDRVLEHEPGKSVTGLKTITRTEDAFEGHYPLRSLYPGSLVIESMVQLLGWLAMKTHDYGILVVLSGIENAKIPPDLTPGTTRTLSHQINVENKRRSVGSTWAEVDGTQVASIERAIYGHVSHPDPEGLRARFLAQGGAL